MKLSKGIPYKLEITHLGFSQLTDTVSIASDILKNYTLFRTTQSLEEVLIKAQLAVIVKEDTIRYRVDKFRTGEERKLKKLLEKLPGVEVDRAGNVKVNGKAVSKLLVEGKEFFTGNEKLGVNNIPADAVEEVVALDDYTEVPFLKELTDSNKLVLNIKLKEGKKNFVFGDIEAGGGVEKRYLFHPSLFYYSPKTAVNAIGDFNNTGQKSFTVQDYVDFEGGMSSFMEDPSAYFDLYTSDFAQFLSQRDFVFNKNNFGAISLSQEITQDLRLSVYSINSQSETETKTIQDIRYLTEKSLAESRLNTANKDLFFSLNKLEMKYTPNYETDLAYNALVKYSNGEAGAFVYSQSPQEENSIRTGQNLDLLKITQNLVLNKQFSYEHTSTLKANYTYHQNDAATHWLFDQPVLSSIVPFVPEDTLNLLQNTNTIAQKGQLRLKHYWILDNNNHVYPVLGLRYSNQNYETLDFQRLADGEDHSFQSSGFNNNTKFGFFDLYAGFEYKRKLGKIILKPGLVYHYFLWNIEQFGERTVDREKGVFLPKMEAKYEISSSETFRLNYEMRTSFSPAAHYANRFRLASFNQVFRGNENLENELRHLFSLNYDRYSLINGVFIYAGMRYSTQVKSVQAITKLEGIDQIQTLTFSDLPQSTFSLSGGFGKQLGAFKLRINGRCFFSDYSRIVNDRQHKYSSQNYSYEFNTKTSFDSLPNFEIGLQQQYSIFEGEKFKNNFMRLEPYLFFDYDFWNGFVVKADYRYTYYENKNSRQINRFQVAEASVYYHADNSPWSFEVRMKNLFDVRYKAKNIFSQFMIMERKEYIQPRTLLFVLSYKL